MLALCEHLLIARQDSISAQQVEHWPPISRLIVEGEGGKIEKQE